MSSSSDRPDFLIRCELHKGDGRPAARFRWRPEANLWAPIPLRQGVLGVQITPLQGDAVDRQWLDDLLAEVSRDITPQEAPTTAHEISRTAYQIFCTRKEPEADNPGNWSCQNRVGADARDFTHLFMLVAHAVRQTTNQKAKQADWVSLFADVATVDTDRNLVSLTILGIRNALAYINADMKKHAGRHTLRHR